MNDTFAVRLLRAESAAGLRSFQLADKADIRRGVLHHLEHGKCLPSYKTLIALSRALGVSIDWLCGLTNDATFKAAP